MATSKESAANTLDKQHWETFLFGGKATFVLTSGKTKTRLVFALRRAKKKAQGTTIYWATWIPSPGQRPVFIGWASVPDVVVGAKATFIEQFQAPLVGESKSACAALRYFFNQVLNGPKSDVALEHDGKCSRCSKLLRDHAPLPWLNGACVTAAKIKAKHVQLPPHAPVTPPSHPQQTDVGADIVGVDDIWGAWRTKGSINSAAIDS